MTSKQEDVARRRYADAIDRAKDEIRKAREEHHELVRIARANGNEEQAKTFALPPAAHAFNTWVGKTVPKLKLKK